VQPSINAITRVSFPFFFHAKTCQKTHTPQCVAACCSVLQCVAACRIVKPSTNARIHCEALHKCNNRVSFLHFFHTKTCTKTPNTAVHCSVARYSVLQRVASVFHCAALHKCNDTSLCSSIFPTALFHMSFEIQKKKRNSFFVFCKCSSLYTSCQTLQNRNTRFHDTITSFQP